MNITQTITIAAVLCLAFGSTGLAQHNQDELKQRVLVLAQSVSPDDYAFTRTIHSEQISGGNVEKHVNVEKYDPAKPGEGRWAIVSVDGASPSADELKTFRTEAAKRRVPGYARLAGYFGTPATASTDARGRTVFHFTALPKETVKVMDTDLSQSATADATVSEANGVPFAEQVHITIGLTRLKLLFKMERFESIARYRVGPEGKPLLMEQTSDMSGLGMGKEGRAHTVSTYSDYRALKR
jgi:hypothetical protein